MTTNYDIHSLDYVFATDPNLLCPICHSPLVDPVQTTCLHTFCSECIAISLERSPTCPVDRKPLEKTQISPAPIMITNLVNDLIIVCPNADEGCQSTCPRYLIDGHLKHICEHVMVKCVGCDELVMRKDAGECLHKEIECEDCTATVRRLDMEDHKAKCPELKGNCEHCAKEFPRSEILSHSKTCPEAIISCTAERFGCPFTSTRSTLPEHVTACAFVQLSPLLQLHTDRIAKLELENRSIRKKLDIIVTRRESTTEDQTYHLFAEQEHLRADVDRLAVNLGDLEVKQAMLLMNENLRYNEEMAAMRAAINGLRMQIHWLMTRPPSNSAQPPPPPPPERRESGASCKVVKL